MQIAVVGGSPFLGALGLTFAPGKTDPHSWPSPWRRDLSTDLDVIFALKARVVVTFLERHEFELLRIPKLGEEIRRRGLEWLHLPIRDVSVPDEIFEKAWPGHSFALRSMLRAGDHVLCHCRGGLGRAGMIAARLLVDEGVAPEAAIAAVRAARPGAIETRAQEDWVRKGASGRTTPQARAKTRSLDPGGAK